MLSRRFWPHVGGVEKHVLGLAEELISRGNRVHIVTEQYDGKLAEKEYYRSIKITRIPYELLGSKWEMWRWVYSQYEYFHKAKVIHAHDVVWWLLPFQASSIRQKVYITFHGYEPGHLPSWKEKVHRKWAEKSAQGNICVGAFIEKWYGTKADAILYGAASAKPTKMPRARSAVYIGRLEADTGIFAYLRALLDIKKGLTWDIYVDGPELAEVKKMVSRNRLPVALHGWTDKPLEKIASARFVFTSQYLSILEAMQSKRLVVAVHNDPLKKDYLYMHPESKHMLIAANGKDLADKFNSLSQMYENEYVEKAYVWARQQTWAKLADTYQRIWDD